MEERTITIFNDTFVKNIIKQLRIAAGMLAIIFSMAAAFAALSLTGCPSPAGGGGGSVSNGGGSGSGGATGSENGFNYRVNSGGATVTITKYNGTGGAVNIPAKLNNKPVTSIGERAFSDCHSLTSVTIPNSVTSIGEGAFWVCTKLTSVTIPSSVTSIGDGAFASCSSLTSVTIPNSVTSIGNWPFSDCTSLTAIDVDAANTAYSSQDGVLYNKAKTILIKYPAKKTGASFIIPSSVTSIGRQAFAGCTSLASVTIPDSVTSIGEGAFSGCTGLASVTIPSTVTSIGDGAFTSCFSLTSVSIPASVTSIGQFAFYSCSSLTSVTFVTGSNISNANFGGSAFPEGSDGRGGDTLKNAYATGKAGTYTRAAGGSTWTKQS